MMFSLSFFHKEAAYQESLKIHRCNHVDVDGKKCEERFKFKKELKAHKEIHKQSKRLSGERRKRIEDFKKLIEGIKEHSWFEWLDGMDPENVK